MRILFLAITVLLLSGCIGNEQAIRVRGGVPFLPDIVEIEISNKQTFMEERQDEKTSICRCGGIMRRHL